MPRQIHCISLSVTSVAFPLLLCNIRHTLSRPLCNIFAVTEPEDNIHIC